MTTLGGFRPEWLTVQQHIPEGAALQGQARQPRGVVLPHTQPQVLGALQPARVPLLQLEESTQLQAMIQNPSFDVWYHFYIHFITTTMPTV